MVAITKDIPSGTTRYTPLAPDGAGGVSLEKYIKPLSYAALGLAFGFAILSGRGQEKSIRGSSLTTVNMKNASELPYIHIDINFPDSPDKLMETGNLPTVEVERPTIGDNANIPVDMNPGSSQGTDGATGSMTGASDGSMANDGTQTQEMGMAGMGSPETTSAGRDKIGNNMVNADGSSMQQDAASMTNGNTAMTQTSSAVDPSTQMIAQDPSSTMGATNMAQDPNQMQGTMMQQGQMQAGTSATAATMQDPNQVQPTMAQPGQVQQVAATTTSNTLDPNQMQPAMMQTGQVQPGQVQPGQVQPGTTAAMQPGTMATTTGAMADPNQMQPGTTAAMQPGTMATTTGAMVDPNQMQPGTAVAMQPGTMATTTGTVTDPNQMQPAMAVAPGTNTSLPQTTSTTTSSVVPGSLPVIYTFFQPISDDERSTGMDDQSDNELLTTWKDRWAAAGWEPRVLTLKDAETHPQFKEISEKVKKIPMEGKSGKGKNRLYNELCFLRWLAMAQIGGGWMSDYDLLPLGPYGTGTATPEPVEILDGGAFTVYSIAKDSQGAGIPCLMSGSAEEWMRMAFSIVENGVAQKDTETKHWTDMFALMDLRFDNLYKVQDQVVDGQYVLIGRDWVPEDCKITDGVRAIHFSHSAMSMGDAAYIKGGKITVSDRPGVVAHWLDVWNNVCLPARIAATGV